MTARQVGLTGRGISMALHPASGVTARVRLQVRGRLRQMREDASYLRKAERRLAATLAHAQQDPDASASLDAESSDGWLMSQQ